ncbi:hypothetical protein OBK20_01655 [Empedobacter falsenii]|uniref:hypothetical protein n=1 Tax=Flavobacteriales TaxID=200644 RepID=UPI0008389DA5|nr:MULTISPECIES: hypothetical protein [Flavobacteriales]MBW1619899.1 hypothetical protein [Empedobacter falsenii]
MKKTTISFFLISSIILSIFTIDRYFNNEEENIAGIIFQIKEGRGGNHYYYDKNKYFTDDEYFENRYSHYLEIGDSVFKEKKSEELKIYKKQKNKYIYEKSFFYKL